MFGWAAKTRMTHGVVEFTGVGTAKRARPVMGFISGTKVATPIGWVAVEEVAEGDSVLTFDGGMQPVVSVRRSVIRPSMDLSDWPLSVPAGALGNRQQMILLPHQPVLVESDAAEDALDDPFALIPAAALVGYRGIQRAAPDHEITVIHIEFERDEIVFANIGALFLCPRALDLAQGDAEEGSFPYRVLTEDQADMLVAIMHMDEAKPTPHPLAGNAAPSLRSVA